MRCTLLSHNVTVVGDNLFQLFKDAASTGKVIVEAYDGMFKYAW
jgi:hypothetical protein